MPRPIVLTKEIKQKALEDFTAMLDGIKMADGKLSYSKTFCYKEGNAVIWLTPEAYRKTLALVMGFSDEVGWHGKVSRVSECKEAGCNEFIVEDIFVYPQEVTGSTVSTDQEAYAKWLYGLDDDTFNSLRMQGHSHCSMGVSPSNVDDKHREKILGQLEPGMFYIFMIWNKSLSVHAVVYDMARNVLYEDKDVNVKLLNDEDMDEFLADAKKKVVKPGQEERKSRQGKSRFKPKKQRIEEAEDYEADEHLRQLGLMGFGMGEDSDGHDLFTHYSRYGYGRFLGNDANEMEGRAWGS